MATKKRSPSREAQSEVLQTMGIEDEPPKEEKTEPLYRIFDDKIPVSKAFGRSVETKMRAAIKAHELVREARNEAYRYYNHNQVKDDISSRPGGSDVRFRRGDSTENIVYGNVSTIVPAIYSKNPDISFSTEQDEDKDFVDVLGKAVQAVMDKKPPLGVNLKSRAKKAVLHAELANRGVLKLDYVLKDDSREQAQEEMDELFAELRKGKTQQEIGEVEGKMMALESQMEWRDPGGFKLNIVIPVNLIVDPLAENEDGSDANWMLEEVYISTDYLNARFTKKVGDERRLLYKPTHKVKLDGDKAEREDQLGLVIERLAEGTDDSRDHTDEERMSYMYQNMTKCWYYWDKTTRRIYLYPDNDWTWPIWVWEDELKTSRFFPYFLIIFSPSTGGIESPSEVSYYLDQQDEINKINAEIARVRRLVFSVLVYNKNKIAPDEARKVINYLKNGTGENALGIDVPEGLSLKDSMETLSPPSINYEAVFDKRPIYDAVDRVGSSSEALRGGQFKTNTPAKVAEQYTAASSIRINNRTDAIENTIEDIAWTIAEILVSQGSKEYITGLIGETNIEKWKSMSIQELNATCSVKVAAGSSEKPTSTRKKEQAIQVAQAVGQFATGAPVSSMRIMLKMLQKAFPELEITEEDWAAILQEMQMQMQRGVSTKGGNGNSNSEGQAIEEQLNSLPEEVKAQVIEQINAGADPRQVIQQLMESQNVQ